MINNYIENGKVEDILKAYFINEDGQKLYLPVDIKNVFDLRNDLTADQINEVWENGHVEYINAKGESKLYKKSRNPNGYTLFYKHTSENIFCMDVDAVYCDDHDENMKDCEECQNMKENLLEVVNNKLPFTKQLPFTTSNNKGFPHFMFIIDQKLEFSNELKIIKDEYHMDVDLIRFRRNTTERKNSPLYNIDDDYTLPVMKWDDIKQYFNTERMGFKNEKPEKKPKKEKVKEEKKEEVIINDEKMDQFKYMKEYELAMLCDLNEFGKYDMWFKLACMLRNEHDDNDMFIVFHEISKQCPKYKGEQECFKKWEEVKDKQILGSHPVTIATLRKMAKDNNKQGYNEWFNKYDSQTLKKLVSEYDLHELAKYFHSIKKNNYIVQTDGASGSRVWYILQQNGMWKKSLKPDGLLLDLVETIKPQLKEFLNTLDVESPLVSKVAKCIKSIGNNGDACFKFLEGLFINENVKFDQKWQLLGFNNGVLDLTNHSFRNYNYSDYVSLSTGYDYRNPTSEEIETLNQLLCKVIPDPEIREFLFILYSTGLEGRTLEKFIILNGEGRNGKGFTDELIEVTLGNYCYVLNNATLTKPIKDGNNPQVANMLNKRIVFAREPEGSTAFCNATIKELTGGSTINTRLNNSNECKIPICPTLIVECNKKPPFKEEITDADVGRIIDVYFPSRFTEKLDECDDNLHVYPVNKEIKTNEWKEKHKFAMLYMLIEHHKKYTQAQYKLITPQVIEQRTFDYLKRSYSVFQWFDEHYEVIENIKVDVKNQKETAQLVYEDKFIPLRDVYNHFKTSETYMMLSKNEKRDNSTNKFIEKIKKSPFFKKYYMEEIDTTIKKKKIHLYNILVGYKKKENIDDDKDEFDDNDNNYSKLDRLN